MPRILRRVTELCPSKEPSQYCTSHQVGESIFMGRKSKPVVAGDMLGDFFLTEQTTAGMRGCLLDYLLVFLPACLPACVKEQRMKIVEVVWVFPEQIAV